MKTALFAAALLVGTAAAAQYVQDPQPEVPETTAETTQGDLSTGTYVPGVTTADPATTTWAPPPATTTLASVDRTVMPSNANPEHDARGIAVISDPAYVPAGFNGVPATAMGGPLEPLGDDASYPPCTASVTDNCLQTYEVGSNPRD